MKKSKLLIPLLVSCSPLVASGAEVIHYWDMESAAAVVGGKDLSPHDSGNISDVPATFVDGTSGTSAGWGSSGAGGKFLHVVLNGDSMEAGAAGDFSFSSDFSVSYWVYHGASSGKGMRTIDTLHTDLVSGFTLATTTTHVQHRFDDTGGADVKTNLSGPVVLTRQEWIQATVTVDVDGDVSYYENGILKDTDSIAGLNGVFTSTQVMEVGGMNNNNTGLGGLDDLAIYNGLLSPTDIAGLAAGTITPLDIDTPPVTPVIPPVAHYWDFDPSSGFPLDLYGELDLADSNAPTTFTDISVDPHYGEAFSGANESLNMALGSSDYLVGDSYNEGASKPTSLDWADKSFSFSYWAYDHSDAGTSPVAGDGDDRGVRVFDCLATDTVGVTVNSNATGVLVVRIDDNAGNSVVSNTVTGFESVAMPANQWVHTSMNVDRVNNQLTIYFDGVAITEGPIDISSLTGDIFGSQDLQVGVINGGGSASAAQKSGIDELAFYPSLLSQDEITALAGASTTPLDVLVSMEPSPPIEIVDTLYVAGKFSVFFASESGKTYSVYGGDDLAAASSWPELTSTPIVGDDTDKNFSVTPGLSSFFMQVRED